MVPARGIEVNRRTSNNLAVYTVEMVAILVALRWVEKTKIVKVLYSVTRITNQGGKVKFVWVAAHILVKGN